MLIKSIICSLCYYNKSLPGLSIAGIFLPQCSTHFFPEAQVFWYHFSKTFNSSPLMKTLNTKFSRDVVISSWLTFHFSYSPPLEITTRQITFLPSLNTLSTRFYLHLYLLNLICPSAQCYLLYKAFPDFRQQPKIWSLVILGHYWAPFLLLLWNLHSAIV